MANKPGAPVFWSEGRLEEWIRKVAQVVNQLQKGQANNSFLVELDENSTTTEVLVSFAVAGNVALWSPQDAATALEAAAGTIYTEVTKGKITVHHGSGTGTRKIGVCLLS